MGRLYEIFISVLPYQSIILSKNHFSRWLLLCEKRFPAFIQINVKKLILVFVSIEFYESFEVTQDYCVSTHNFNCSLESCQFHILLIGSHFNKILQRSAKFHFTYQFIGCLYTKINLLPFFDWPKSIFLNK